VIVAFCGSGIYATLSFASTKNLLQESFNVLKFFITKTAASMFGLRHYGVNGLSRWASRAPSRCILHQKELGLSLRPFSASLRQYKKQDVQEDDEKKASVKTKPGPKARQTSLHRVAIQAERSRQIIQDKGGRRIIDPDIETKVSLRSMNGSSRMLTQRAESDSILCRRAIQHFHRGAFG
jgi:hypothetical protein